jgi:hypothetical protein
MGRIPELNFSQRCYFVWQLMNLIVAYCVGSKPWLFGESKTGSSHWN